MRFGVLVVLLSVALAGCDDGAAAPAAPGTARRDVTYIVYATGPRVAYHLVASGPEPYPLVRDTAGSVAFTYTVTCGRPVALSVEARGAVPTGANLTLQVAAGGLALARTEGRPPLNASGMLRC